MTESLRLISMFLGYLTAEACDFDANCGDFPGGSRKKASLSSLSNRSRTNR